MADSSSSVLPPISSVPPHSQRQSGQSKPPEQVPGKPLSSLKGAATSSEQQLLDNWLTVSNR